MPVSASEAALFSRLCADERVNRQPLIIIMSLWGSKGSERGSGNEVSTGGGE